MKIFYEVGRTLRTDKEFPQGVPCIIYDGDSVLCEFRGSNGMNEAARVCMLLNAVANFHEGEDA